MRKRETQVITLKLNDLKEYEAIRQERAAAKQQEQNNEVKQTPANNPVVGVTKIGPKTKQEIRDRIGLSME